jgi:hypothetical protein
MCRLPSEGMESRLKTFERINNESNEVLLKHPIHNLLFFLFYFQSMKKLLV